MKPVEFPPPRQRGLAVHTGLLIALSILTALFAVLASRLQIGPLFMLFILLAVVAFFPLPVLVYRLYALRRSNYSLDRDKLTITWGLRVEQIPLSDIEWVRPLSALAGFVPLPVLYLPGSVLGHRRHADLGTVEFIASEARSLLLVATARQVFAISPEDATNFMLNIQRAVEMGSLSPAASESVYPSFVLAQAWESLLVRYIWLADLFLNIGLLAWVSLMIPSLGRIPLGFLPSGTPGEPVAAAGLMLLPAVSVFLSLLGWITGLIFYRRPDQHLLAHIVWFSGVLSTLLFLVAVLFLVITPA